VSEQQWNITGKQGAMEEIDISRLAGFFLCNDYVCYQKEYFIQ
jgi:hypothetical protein